ncbi:hypothetical protein H4582DRAFT_1927642 [Lactarius indigo]|nr:hypothetical protein H4582DRAFT_1927642 [Lactarius indigo]
MSTPEAPIKAEQLHEISDSVAAMVACILQEQLVPIMETIREHSRLLDWHSALLNHSTIMNRYNVGKLDDLRDLQTNVNYKLQFHIDPEDRKRPTYRGPQPTSALQSTAITTTSTTSSPQKDAVPLSKGSPADSSSRDRTDSPSGTSSVTSAPDAPTRQLTPVFKPPASNSSSQPTLPKVAAGDCGAPTTTKRGLRRERAHDETPDPIWNSSREIDLSEPVPAPVPPPPYVPPPAYTNGAAARRSETKEEDTPDARPSEKAAGKKRKRDDDGEAHGDPPDSSSGCGEPERKRKDTTISTERIPIPESFLRVARLNIFGEPSFEERRCEVEQMRYMKNLFRGGAT